MVSFLDLFAGAGGLSLGFIQAGWLPLLAVDNWDDAVATYQDNFDHKILNTCITEFKEHTVRKHLGQRPDWVVGGPPCQGFSTVGKRQREDPRNLLVHEYARVVNMLLPQGFLMENVVGLRDMQFVDFVKGLFPDYRVTFAILTAADYGVPQLRRRVLFIGHREGMCFIPPKPTHSTGNYVSVWDAIGDLPPLEAGGKATLYEKAPKTGYQRQLRGDSKILQGHEASRHPARLIEAISYVPDGGNRRHIPERLQPKSGYHNSYSRLHSRLPAVAVTQNMGKPSGTRCIHPFQNRGLTAREGARLQGFPDSFHFKGGVTSQRLQIANAVSPILATALALALADGRHWTDKQLLASLPVRSATQCELPLAAAAR